ncbi:hypothetical protein PMAYCL1PPCAC_23849, partial [Pristionchus mayeri]
MDDHNADETTFLTRHTTVRRYGTTLKSSNSSPVQYSIYNVQPSETLQGIALKHDTTVAELKRINKLWNDSIILKSYIKVPVKESASLKDEACITTVPHDSQPESVKDILSRIDGVIKSSAISVKRMEKDSSFINTNSSSS